ncbi:MAG: hypothetical protein WA210_13590, partial [Burkholderiaceae bacterium]
MNKGWQILLIVTFGVGSFYAAANWSRQGNSTGGAGSNAIVESVTPRAVPRPPADALATSEQTLSSLPLARSGAIPKTGGNAFARLSWVPQAPPPPP